MGKSGIRVNAVGFERHFFSEFPPPLSNRWFEKKNLKTLREREKREEKRKVKLPERGGRLKNTFFPSTEDRGIIVGQNGGRH